ncbi:MAG TPA: zinc-ribbon domain-containing protein, partial [Anaeromyxobacteraceae bacterium]
MLIRCEKCTTTYELDEALLPPQGAPVQCSRCQFVFTARPEAAAPEVIATSAPTPTPTSTP